jgi:uncharacterized membrane protein
MIIWALLVVIVIALLMGAAAFVMEKLIPGERRRKHNDVIGFVYAVVGVAYAVLLGLVVIAAWNTLDLAKANAYRETNALIQLSWYGHSLPQPQHARIEGLVKEYTTVVITTEWPLLAHQEDSPRAWATYAELRALVQAQQPVAPAAVIRYQEGLQASGELGDARRERINQAAEGIPGLLWTALEVGGIITIGFPLFFGMKSTIAHAFVMFSLTLLIGSLLLVVFELNYPFVGIVRVSPEAFKLALERIQQLP